MAEIVALTGGLTVVEKTARLVSGAMESNPVRHGLGVASVEKERCPQIHVYLRCVGKVSSLAWKQRLLLPSDVTVGEAKKKLEVEWGKPVKQSQLVDEDGYTFSRSMLEEPLWKFSSNCKLSIDLRDPITPVPN